MYEIEAENRLFKDQRAMKNGFTPLEVKPNV
jgi:hypothetical protein